MEIVPDLLGKARCVSLPLLCQIRPTSEAILVLPETEMESNIQAEPSQISGDRKSIFSTQVSAQAVFLPSQSPKNDIERAARTGNHPPLWDLPEQNSQRNY
jgi:hypothetical protein